MSTVAYSLISSNYRKKNLVQLYKETHRFHTYLFFSDIKKSKGIWKGHLVPRSTTSRSNLLSALILLTHRGENYFSDQTKFSWFYKIESITQRGKSFSGDRTRNWGWPSCDVGHIAFECPINVSKSHLVCLKRTGATTLPVCDSEGRESRTFWLHLLLCVAVNLTSSPIIVGR